MIYVLQFVSGVNSNNFKMKMDKKNTIIALLSGVLLLVLGIAIGFGVSHERGGKGEGRGHGFSENGGEVNKVGAGYVDDNNKNPNDAEVNDDQATSTSAVKTPAK